MSAERLPIVIGVTGHRNLRQEDREALKALVRSALEGMQSRCPHSPIILLDSLAEGADQLCAEVAKELSIPLIAALPLPLDEYAADFSPAGKEALFAFAHDAQQCFVVPHAEAEPDALSRDFAYRQASIYVATHCHMLLALWDGDDSKKDGCGTAAAVHVALNGAYVPKTGIPVRSASNTVVCCIAAAREGTEPEASRQGLEYRGDMVAWRRIMKDTDEWNRLASDESKQPGSLLPEEPDDPIGAKLDRLYGLADAMSMRFQQHYRRVLALLAAFGTLLTVSFLLYDEASLHVMIFVTGLMLLLMVLCRRYARRADCHKRYLENRVLAESLRTQAFLRYAGSDVQVSSLLPLIQQTDTAWVLCALCTCTVGDAPKTAHDIRAEWVDAQCAYHTRAAKKTERKLTGTDRFVRFALIGSAVVYLAALLFELLFGGFRLLPGEPLENAEFWRSVLKIVLGTLSAGTLFIAGYYGKLSLDRKQADHLRMAGFYAEMGKQLLRQGQTDALLVHLAREELIENGNWYAYQSDNTPDLTL